MTKQERVVQQRILAIEGLSKLKSVSELFGVEVIGTNQTDRDFAEWAAKIRELERWVFDESPIA